MKFYLTISCSNTMSTETSGLYIFADTVCDALEKTKQIFYASNMFCDCVSITLNQQIEGLRENQKKKKVECIDE